MKSDTPASPATGRPGREGRRAGISGLLRRLRRQDRGVAALEAAIVLPFLVFFIFGTIETYQYFRAAAIIDRAVFSVADGVSMQNQLYIGAPCDAPDHVCTYGVLMDQLMQPLDYANTGYMTIRLFVANPSGRCNGTGTAGPAVWCNTMQDAKLGTVGWSLRCVGTSPCATTPALSTPANGVPVAGMPTPQANDTVVVVQVWQPYEPFVISSRFWTSLGGMRTLTATAFYRPRFDDLKQLVN